MAKNASLRKADRVKEDEFYTRLTDIENELRHYKQHFVGKTVFCNCDDPFESNFFKYFAMNFNHLGLKKLIATCYVSSPVAGQQISMFDILPMEGVATKNKQPHKIEITEVLDANGDGAIDLTDVEYLIKNRNNVLTLLEGDGDFRSAECIEIMKEADVIVTNPPFSLFREYVAQLMEYNKSFLIIGNQNALTYKEIFPLLKDNKMWLGYHCGDMAFAVPEHYEERATRFWIDENGQKWRSLDNICWYTNLDIKKRHENLDMYRQYKGNEEEYPTYDNYEAINVDRVSEIPEDYMGIMGVPITFLDKYNPEQFKIIDGIGRYSILDNENTKKAGKYLSMIAGKAKYFRIIVRRKRK